jgi:hypothetical protein
MIHEGDVSSVQCEKNLWWTKSMREVDDPNSILIFLRLYHVSMNSDRAAAF